jgi:hypothetical protein
VQTRRAEALSGFHIASPLHKKKETPGEAPGVAYIGHSYMRLRFEICIRARASAGPYERRTNPFHSAEGPRAVQRSAAAE